LISFLSSLLQETEKVRDGNKKHKTNGGKLRKNWKDKKRGGGIFLKKRTIISFSSSLSFLDNNEKTSSRYV
jgi:hypothetical protein